MAEEEERRRKKKGLFGRKKKKKKDGSIKSEVSFSSKESSLLDEGSNDGQPRKKRGFGTRIKRMVGGRKRSKKGGDEDSAISYLDKDDPNYRGPRTSLDPDILAKVMAKDGSQRDQYAPNSRMGGSIDEAIDEEGEEDEMDIMSYGQAVDDDLDEPGDLSLPVGVVLLMVDPETLRFELLQLDFETPLAAKVQEVLDQARDSVSEPALKGLDFHAVVDRKGNQFSAAAPLTKALTNRKRSRDILVGLSRGVSVEKCGRLARPILGDAKVILMLEANGYDVEGWAKNKKEESELKDTKPDSFAVAERKRQFRVIVIVLGALLVGFCFYEVFQYLFGGTKPLPVMEIIENVTENATADIVLEGEEVVEEASLEMS